MAAEAAYTDLNRPVQNTARDSMAEVEVIVQQRMCYTAATATAAARSGAELSTQIGLHCTSVMGTDACRAGLD